MPIKIGNNNIEIKIGTTSVSKVYVGTVQIYPNTQWNTVWSGGASYQLNGTVTTANIPAGATIRITYRDYINGTSYYQVATGNSTYVGYENAIYVDDATLVYEVGYYGWEKQSTTQLKVIEELQRAEIPPSGTYITKIEAYY